jgi:SAM-dependent methyltransferase
LPENERFDLQEELYSFPYHWLPHIDTGGAVRLYRALHWGLDYLTYMSKVVQLVADLRPRSLCDIGCGDGRLISLLAQPVPRVVGIDVSERAVEFARAFNPGADVRCMDVAEIDEQFDLITLVEVLEHIPSPGVESFIHSVAAGLVPEGRLIVTVPSTNVPINPKHYRHYNLETLTATLSPLFVVERHWWLYRRGVAERFWRRLLLNRLFVLHYAPALRLLWRLHRRFSFEADSTTGLHLVCVAKKR